MGIGRNAVTKIVGTPLPSGIQGDVLYHNGSNWVVLNPGTANQVLTTNGSSVNPSWTNKTSATGVVAGTDKMVQFNDGGSDFGGEANFLYFKNSANLTISGSSGYALSTYASSSAQSASGIDVWDYDKVQKLQVGYNNLSNESYIWATTTSNNLKFGTDGTKRMEILASNGKVLTSNDLHVSGTLTADTNTLVGTDTLWTQKGDLVVGTGSDTAQRLASAAGDNGQVLTIDTGETTGLKWADPGGVEIIANYHVPVASASTGITGSRYVSSPIRIDPVGGDWEDGNVVITDDPGIGTVSTTGLGKLSLISQTGSSMLGVAASGAATTIAKFGSITNHTSTLEFIHNGYNASDILSKIVMTSGTTTIGATGTHKFILTGGLGITAASSKPADSVTKPVLWVSGTSNALFLGDRQMVTAGSSALTAGYVPYVSSSAKHGLGNSVLYNDSTNSRIGINTASPNRAFDVRGTSLLSGNTKVVGTGEITSTLDVGTNITGTGTATFKTATLNNIVLDPSNRAAFIKLQDSSRTTTTASRNPELLLNQILIDSGSDKADFPTIRFTKAGPVDISSSYTNLGYRIYVSGETGAGTVDAPQAMIWDFNSDTSDPLNYTEKLALTTAGGLRINNAYTLPTAAPASNGYVITGATDGTTAWVANSGGGGGGSTGYWSLGSSSKIYYNSGNVGIGEVDPDEKLHVRGNALISGNTYISQGVGLGTQSIDTRQSEGLVISGTNITDTWSDTDTKRKPTSLFIPSLTSGAYVLAGVGGKNVGMASGRAEPPYMIIGASEQTTLHNNAMNSGRAVSLVLAGTAGYNSGGTDYGNFGSLIFHGNSNWSGNARRWLVSNAWRNSGAGDMGLGFASETTSSLDPTISGTTPNIVMSTDSNYGVAGKQGLIVGNKTHIGGGLITSVSTTNPQLTLAYDGGDYATFKTDSSGILTIATNMGGTGVADRFKFDGNHFRGTDTNAPSMRNETPSSTNPVFTFNNDVDTGMSRGAANELSLITSGTEAIRIDSLQNVGIGTTAPTEKLDVRGNTFLSGTAQIGPTIADGSASPKLSFGGTSHWIRNSSSDLELYSGDDVFIQAADDVRIRGDDVQIMDADGNVNAHFDGGLNALGLGTDTPSTKLDVVGTITAGANSYLEIQDNLISGSSGHLQLYAADNLNLNSETGITNFQYQDAEKFRITAGSSSPIAFQPKADSYDMSFKQYDGKEVMRMTDTELVGIGNFGTKIPHGKLHISSSLHVNNNNPTGSLMVSGTYGRFQYPFIGDAGSVNIANIGINKHTGLLLSTDTAGKDSYIQLWNGGEECYTTIANGGGIGSSSTMIAMHDYHGEHQFLYGSGGNVPNFGRKGGRVGILSTPYQKGGPFTGFTNFKNMMGLQVGSGANTETWNLSVGKSLWSHDNDGDVSEFWKNNKGTKMLALGSGSYDVIVPGTLNVVGSLYQNGSEITPGGGGGGAPTDAQYVTLATDGDLSAERVLTAGSDIDLADGGAGSTVTINLESELNTPTGIYNTSLKVGRDAHNLIDYSTDDEINFRAGNADQMKITDGTLEPETDNDVALGTLTKAFAQVRASDAGAFYVGASGGVSQTIEYVTDVVPIMGPGGFMIGVDVQRANIEVKGGIITRVY